MKGEPGGQVVGVGHVDDLAGERRVAGDRGLVEGHRELLERHGHRVVLGQLEAQLVVRRASSCVLAALHEVEAARVGGGDLAALGEDQLQQLVDVALGGEGDADLVQLVQLLALAGQRVVELLDDAPAVDGVEGAVQAQAQPRRR